MLNFIMGNKGLKDFKKNSISIDGLKSLVGGAKDTTGGYYFFGYGTSTCDIVNDDGTWDHYFGDGRWLQGASPPDGH
jgi:hypothetical protein